MSILPATLQESYRFCRAVARAAGSSFYPCFRLLPRRQRRAMEALYAFLRHTDDLGDDPRPVADRRVSLEQWREAVQRVLRGDTADSVSEDARRLLPAVVDTVRHFAIPPEHLLAVIEGVGSDLQPRVYETFDELAEYCHLVASSVGLACLHVWGFDGPAAFAPARRCGLAFQMTNILRDLGEDAQAGRVYLPREDFRQAGYSVDSLQRRELNGAFLRLVAIESTRIAALYHDGAELLEHLAPSGRRVFGMMMSVYHRLFRKIQRSPERLLVERVSLSRLEKLRIAARWILLPPRRAALP